jgi:hypothetical protein
VVYLTASGVASDRELRAELPVFWKKPERRMKIPAQRQIPPYHCTESFTLSIGQKAREQSFAPGNVNAF